MNHETQFRRSNDLKNQKGWIEFAQGAVSIFSEFPVWTTIFSISEIVQGALIIGEGIAGRPPSLSEVESRFQVTTILGMLGGTSAEVIVRLVKWFASRQHHPD